ncbi:erythromycin esterase family protein [Aeromicrobium sp. CnD17-E]|uniref:erythromycin esterase family protein n=1 Tax=Aeromicrobium sp. CnD17-E TaxID=2954487 RepID=UPI0020979D5A|nr:erythromycin esterase family protein [Aeromicrobium sp. CnD17-E]MCO7237835.1 erythromycin esterase family protein [Aeromicrobium sp. CnD17-E]
MSRDEALTGAIARAARPLDIDDLAASLADATVVGLAPTTREAQEVADIQADLVTALVERGTSTFVLQDTTDIGARLDAWVHDRAGEDLSTIQDEMWGPWQTMSLARTIHRLREHQRAHPPVALEVRGIRRPTATVADYDAVVAAVSGRPQSEAVSELLTTIRVAHGGGEHVERAHGRWDGPPFVELARAARDLTAVALAGRPALSEARLRLDRIVEFHATSLSQGHDGSEDERRAAEELIGHLTRTGRRAVVWDGIGHLAGAGPAFGSRLRDVLLDDYRCVLTTFGQGRIRDLDLPPPRADSLEASLEVAAASFGGSVVVDLRADGRDLLTKAHHVRLVSGMYEPTRDDRHYITVDDMPAAFDVLVHVPRVSPATFIS